jgi:hypothetical protein
VRHTCRSCGSHNQNLFPSELMIHFPGGLEALDKGDVMIFPELRICLDCGFTDFQVPEQELRLIRQKSAA